MAWAGLLTGSLAGKEGCATCSSALCADITLLPQQMVHSDLSARGGPLLVVVGDCLLPKSVICLKKQGARGKLQLLPKPSADTRNVSTWEGGKLEHLPPGHIPDTMSVTHG